MALLYPGEEAVSTDAATDTVEKRKQPELVIDPAVAVREFRSFGGLLPHPLRTVVAPSVTKKTLPQETFSGGRIAYGTSDVRDVGSPADLLVLVNHQGSPEQATEILRSGGRIIANNRYETALLLHKDPRFRLQAVRPWCHPDPHFIDVENLDDNFADIETYEEFRRDPDRMREAQEAVRTRIESILWFLTAGIVNVRDDLVRRYKEFLSQSTERMSPDLLWVKGKLHRPLPRKKPGYHFNDLFLFERSRN